jgi:MinD-like ATPase involved in chromosome partitioning or flagellar assembly
VIDGPEGVQIIPGASGFAQCVELDVGQQQRLVTSVQSIEPHYDYMLVDTAAGISPTVLHFIAASQVAVIVITPEPTSLTDAFSLLKVLRRRGYRRKVQVIVNMASSSVQADKVFRRFRDAVFKYLELAAEYLGTIWMDESMRAAVTLQRPVALYPKNDPSARSFYRLAERIDDVFSQKGVPKLAFSAYWQKLLERYTSSKTLFVDEKISENRQNSPETVLSQIQKQQAQRISVSDSTASIDKTNVIEPLSEQSDVEWSALRVRLNKFFSDENTTPEQVTTLLSSCIYSFGDRLGGASVDLIHGLVHSLKPEKLSDEQKQLLLSDYEYLGLDDYKQSAAEGGISVSEPHEEDSNVNDDEIIKVKQSYDASGFGCQQELAKKIRNASDNLPLESLLESIKYASLVDSSGS